MAAFRKRVFISELLEEEELSELVKIYHCGLELIRFGVSENLDHFQQTLDKEKKMLQRLGNPPVTLHGPFLDLNPMSFDSGIRRVTWERFHQAYLAGMELGAERIVFHSGMIPTVYYLEGWAERIADFFLEFLQEHRDIMVCMENVLDREIIPFLEVAESVTRENFGICLDIGHAHCYSAHSVLEWAEELQPWVRHVHLHDNMGDRDSHLALGEGNIPLESLLKVLDTGPAPVTWTIECSTKEQVRKSLEILKSCL